MAKTRSIFGRWRITHMDEWGQDFVDAEVEGYVRFDSNGTGGFQFGYVHGRMSFDQPQGGGSAAVEWSWEGNDEMEPASGRGWAALEADGTLKGKLYFSRGDSSGFTAGKKPGKRTPSEKLKDAKAKRRSEAARARTVAVNVDAIRPGRIGNTEIDGYISQFPAHVSAVLAKVRETIKDAAPDATEVISYQMPAFKGHGILVYFAAWKNHIGLYPPVSGDKALEDAVARYAGPKGNLQFPLDEPMPHELIGRIVRLRARQDAEKAAAKERKSQASRKPKGST